MKKILACKVTIFLFAGWIILSVIGYLEKDRLYQAYTVHEVTTPYFVLVLNGIHDGIYPWSKETVNGWSSLENTGKVPSSGDSGSDIAAIDSEENTTEAATDTVVTPEDTSAVIPESEAPGSEALLPETEIGTEVLTPLEFVTVDESYFDDAVFIGDSRTEGLRDYGGLDNATFYASTGLSVFKMWTDEFCEYEGQKVTLEEALTQQKFGKIYFQIGINEMGRGTLDEFMEAYTQSVRKMQELQPDAIIFVQGIMKVTKEKSDSDAIFNNAAIQTRNDRIATLADYVHIFYIDMNEAVCDEEGNLRADLTYDNLHLFGAHYDLWVDFLLTKGIVKPE